MALFTLSIERCVFLSVGLLHWWLVVVYSAEERDPIPPCTNITVLLKAFWCVTSGNAHHPCANLVQIEWLSLWLICFWWDFFVFCFFCLFLTEVFLEYRFYFCIIAHNVLIQQTNYLDTNSQHSIWKPLTLNLIPERQIVTLILKV